MCGRKRTKKIASPAIPSFFMLNTEGVCLTRTKKENWEKLLKLPYL